MFVFVTCQVGTETICKQRILAINESVRFAFSRPGCLTFKLGEHPQQVLTALAIEPFVRTFGYSLKVVKGEEGSVLATQVWEMVGEIDDVNFKHLHCWSRDQVVTGVHGFEPQVTPLAQAVGELIASHRPANTDSESETTASHSLSVNRLANSGEWILDVVIIEPNEWLVGFHQAESIPTRWPGGIPPFEVEGETVSRAYLKMAEAIEWSRIPFHQDETVVEIGSAPGGSCQFLLEQEMKVIGVDPAEMDEDVLSDPNFEHWKMRGSEIKRKSLQGVTWLTVDVNIAPQPMLQMVRELVTHEKVKIQGMILTLKLSEWEQAKHLESWLKEVRSWGFKYVKVRHLVYNRQELCLVALRRKSLLRVHRPKG